MHGAKGIEPRTEVDGVNRNERRSHLLGGSLPVGAGRIVHGQGTCCGEHAHVARLSGFETVPEFRDQLRAIVPHGVSQYREFGRGCIEQSLLEKLKLRAIDRE